MFTVPFDFCGPCDYIFTLLLLFTYLVLLLDDLVGLWLLICHIDALEAVDVLGQAGLGDVSLPGLNGLHKGVVDEDVLLLRLDEAVALTSAIDQSNVKKTHRVTTSAINQSNVNKMHRVITSRIVKSCRLF